MADHEAVILYLDQERPPRPGDTVDYGGDCVEVREVRAAAAAPPAGPTPRWVVTAVRPRRLP